MLGDTLINRLRHPFGKFHTSDMKERMNDTESEGSGKFVVLHLRFDKVCLQIFQMTDKLFTSGFWKLFGLLKEIVAELETFFFGSMNFLALHCL